MIRRSQFKSPFERRSVRMNRSMTGKRFYVDDSEKRNIRVYDVAADGTLRNGRIFGEEPGGKDDGVPDGIKVDRNGNLFVSGPERIWVWDAKGHPPRTIS